MGWWAISGDGGGVRIVEGLDFASRGDAARSGELLVNGDEVADLLGPCADKVIELWKRHWGRPPTRHELRAAFQFVIAPLADLDP